MAQTVNRRRFWAKVRRTVGKVPFVPDAVALYFCLLDGATPLWAKGQIAAALTYFVSPIDLIPDALIPIGYTDDAAVIATTLTLIGSHVTPEHHRKARQFLDE